MFYDNPNIEKVSDNVYIYRNFIAKEKLDEIHSIIKTLEEYEITSVQTPTSTNNSMSFSLNKNIDLGTIQSFSANNLTGSIKRYIISRKIPDETNIVIDYQKRDGQTSAGVVKNTNLAPDIDAKMANIVSDLKSKIFSTVLIP